MNMDLINDLAVAFLVEKKLLQKINSREALDLISRVQEVLQPVSTGKIPVFNPQSNEPPKPLSH